MIKAAVLGSPISHSLSPMLHRTAYRELSVDGQYDAIEVKAGKLGGFIDSLDTSWTGFSLTMPLKEEVLSLVHDIDPLAAKINSANTIIRSLDRWWATSTDVNGFRQALFSHGVQNVSRVLILGSGATARAVAAACNGISSEILVMHRSPFREISMRQCVDHEDIFFLPWDSEIPSVDLVVNTTPAGVADEFVERFPHFKGIYFEALYSPWPTHLLGHFRERGNHSIDGLDFLIQQGIDQVALMTGKTVNREELAPILRQACLSLLEKS